MTMSPPACASGEDGGALRGCDLLLRAVDGAERDEARRVGVAMRALDVLAMGLERGLPRTNHHGWHCCVGDAHDSWLTLARY